MYVYFILVYETTYKKKLLRVINFGIKLEINLEK